MRENRGDVPARYRRLLRHGEVTVASLMKELDEDRELARQLKQPSAAIAATVAQAKLAGLIVDRKEVGQPGEFENMKAEELAEVLARDAAALGAEDVGEKPQ
jgi:hypothetical protein